MPPRPISQFNVYGPNCVEMGIILPPGVGRPRGERTVPSHTSFEGLSAGEQTLTDGERILAARDISNRGIRRHAE